MRSSLYRSMSLLALVVLASAGCQSSAHEVPVAGSVPDIASDPQANVAYSGVYSTFVKYFKKNKGGAAVTIQISPRTSSCGSYIIVKPTGTKPAFKRPYYEAPITLTSYKPGRKTADFAGTADLGSDIGTLMITGAVGGKKLGISYKDKTSAARFEAGYRTKCHARLPHSGPPPAPSAFVGSWQVDIDIASSWLYGLNRSPGQLATMVISSASAGSTPGEIDFTGQVTNLTLFYFTPSGGTNYTYGAPYTMKGSWANGSWTAEVYSGVSSQGTYAGAYYLSTNDWYPPSFDKSGGQWQVEGDLGPYASGGIYCAGPSYDC